MAKAIWNGVVLAESAVQMCSKLSDASFLTKVFDQDGAQVWQVKAAGS